MPPRRSAETDALRAQLARLLRQDVSLIGDLRKTPEAPPQLSVFDLARALTPSSSPSSVVGDVYLMVAGFDEHFSDHAFDDDHATPVVNLAVVAEIIFLLPGPSPASVRCEAARLFAQYLDGDVSAVARVEQMAHVQEHLRLRETEADVLRWKRRPAWWRYWCCRSEGRG